MHRRRRILAAQSNAQLLEPQHLGTFSPPLRLCKLCTACITAGDTTPAVNSRQSAAVFPDPRILNDRAAGEFPANCTHPSTTVNKTTTDCGWPCPALQPVVVPPRPGRLELFKNVRTRRGRLVGRAKPAKKKCPGKTPNSRKVRGCINEQPGQGYGRTLGPVTIAIVD